MSISTETPIAAGLPEPIEPERLYRIQLTRSIAYAGGMLRASSIQVVTGAVLEMIKEHVYGAEAA